MSKCHTTFEIEIEVSGGALKFVDEGKHDGEYKLVKRDTPNQTISWYSDDGDIEITFFSSPFVDKEVHFSARAGHCTSHTLASHKKGDSFKYTVKLTDPKGKTISKDPQIIFADVLENQGVGLFSPSPADIATAAEQAWEKLFAKLTSLRQAEVGDALKLYPGGITDIEVTVGFAGVTITVKVSGPDK